MFYSEVIGCDMAIGGAFDSFVGAVREVVKSPVTKAIAGGVAVAFPPVGVPAAAALVAADLAITTAESSSGKTVTQLAKEAQGVLATTKKAADAGDSDALRARRIILLDKLAETQPARNFLAKTLENKGLWLALGAKSGAAYEAVRKRVKALNVRTAAAARAQGKRPPIVKRKTLPRLVQARDLSQMAMRRIDELGKLVRYATAANFLKKASGNNAVRKLLGAPTLTSAGQNMVNSIKAAIERYNASGQKRGERRVTWQPLARGGSLPTVRKRAPLPTVRKKKAPKVKPLPPGKLVKKGPVAVGERTAGIIITPTAIQHGQWARTA